MLFDHKMREGGKGELHDDADTSIVGVRGTAALLDPGVSNCAQKAALHQLMVAAYFCLHSVIQHPCPGAHQTLPHV